VRTAWFAHFSGPDTIPNRPIGPKFGLELMTSPKKLSRRFCGPRLSGCIGTLKNCLKQACFAHFGWPGTIPNKPIRHKFGLEKVLRNLPERFVALGCLDGLVATVRTACFAHFGGPGTIPNRPKRHKFGLELMTSPKISSRKFCGPSGPRSSGCIATLKNCLKQACFAHFGRPGTIPNRPIWH